MDEMKIKLNTRFMRGVVAKLISRVIYNKVGFKPEIKLNEMDLELKDGTIYFHISADGSINEQAFLKINQMIDD